jgi:hypothetical protein
VSPVPLWWLLGACLMSDRSFRRVLDQDPISEGSTRAEPLHNSMDLATSPRASVAAAPPVEEALRFWTRSAPGRSRSATRGAGLWDPAMVRARHRSGRPKSTLLTR